MIITLISFVLHAQNGFIKIKVLDEQKLNLPGANVSLDNKRYVAVSDNSGIATFYNIPNGKHIVTIAYLGYKDYSKNIESSGSVTEISVNLESGVTILSNVIVLGDRLKGQAKALNQ